MRYFVYVKSSNLELVLRLGAIALKREHIFLPCDSMDSFLAQIDSNSRGIIVLYCQPTVDATMDEIAQLRMHFPGLPILLAVNRWSSSDSVAAARSGATNVFDWPCSDMELEKQLEAVTSDSGMLVNEHNASIPSFVKRLLQSQEIRILSFLMAGTTVKEIASKLDVSVRTIHYRKNDIFEKLGVRCRSEAIRLMKG